ncbi:MAG: AMP-binding protein, partial [Pseudomonadota bacterium]|nr:AMP-binding protein [Pseudomonadota bacterium]
MNEFLPAHHALVNWASKMPDREFLLQPVDGEIRCFTWKESADISRRIASALGSMGLKPGDKVAILAKNSAEWLLTDIAIAMAGMISVPIYPTASVETISYI